MSAVPLLDAIVLAGSRGGSDPVAKLTGVPMKCLAPVGGVPMVSRVLDVLASHPRIGALVLVVEERAEITGLPIVARLRAEGRLTLLAPAPTPSTSVRAALGVSGRFPVLVTTADHALLDRAILDRFTSAAMASGADVAVGMAPAAAILAAYPESVRTFWRFRDERYSGANLFALLTPAAESAVAFWRRVEQERKRPWRIAKVFGWGNLVAYLLGRLSLEQAMARASAVVGCTVRAIPIPIAEAAIDVDKPEDLRLVERIVAARASS